MRKAELPQQNKKKKHEKTVKKGSDSASTSNLSAAVHKHSSRTQQSFPYKSELMVKKRRKLGAGSSARSDRMLEMVKLQLVQRMRPAHAGSRQAQPH